MTAKTKNGTLATVLVITLEPDGSGSLLARRGELAHLSQFTYNGLAEIVAAIQHGATALIGVEANPPTLETPSAAPIAEQANTDEPHPEATETTDEGN